MDVHDSPATTNQSKQVDNHNMIRCSSLFNKRPYQNTQDLTQYEPNRKRLHLDDQNQDLNTVTPIRKKKEPQLMQTMMVKEQQKRKIDYRDSVLGVSLRQKYAHLIPDYQSADYTLDQKILLRIQSRLDQHLLYLKLHRGKKCGDFFKSCHIIIELYHLKQILFIDNQLYICNREKDKDHIWDILIDLPPNADLIERKREFKEKLYRFIIKNKVMETEEKQKIVIPFFKFQFEEKIQQNNNLVLKKQQKQLTENKIKEAIKQQKKLSIKNIFAKDFKFKETLYEKIVAKQNKIKEQTKSGLEVKKFGKQQILKVLDQLHLAYTAKNIFNMFRATLIEIICKQNSMQENIVSQILQVICQKTDHYLKKVQHSKGLILQMDRKFYSQARTFFANSSI